MSERDVAAPHFLPHSPLCQSRWWNSDIARSPSVRLSFHNNASPASQVHQEAFLHLSLARHAVPTPTSTLNSLLLAYMRRKLGCILWQRALTASLDLANPLLIYGIVRFFFFFSAGSAFEALLSAAHQQMYTTDRAYLLGCFRYWSARLCRLISSPRNRVLIRKDEKALREACLRPYTCQRL